MRVDTPRAVVSGELMGWKGFMRDLQAAARRAQRQAEAQQRAERQKRRDLERQQRQSAVAEKRQERESAARHKRLLAEMREAERLDEQARARNEVALFENYLERIVSLHKECWLPWSWEQVAASPPPPPPVFQPHAEQRAAAASAAYSPSMAEKLLGQESLRRAELARAIDAGRAEDHARYQQEVEGHRQEHARWDWFNRVSAGVLSGEAAAYEAVLAYLSPFDELSDLGSDVAVSAIDPSRVRASLAVRDPDVIPDELLSLGSNGKLSRKKMPAGRYWELYQDHVCSCALRIAREVFALLPVDIAFVDVRTRLLNKATGHEELQPILSVGFSRSTVERLNLDALDPSDSMRNFVHRMTFAKSTGFKAIIPVEPKDLAKPGE